MSRVERCYRRLIRLLPAEERAARGEEFLGLLLEMEEGRAWPSAPEVAALLALAVRLHLRRLGVARLGIGLLGAYLMVIGTSAAGQLLGGALDPGVGSPYDPLDSWALAFVLVRLGIAVFWMLGAYRTTLILVTAFIVLQIDELRQMYISGAGFQFVYFMLGGMPGLIWYAISCIGVPAVLMLAVKRKPARKPRSVGLACLAIAFAVQTALYVGSGPAGATGFGAFSDRFAAWLLGAACAAVIAVHARHRAKSVLVTAVIVGLAGGWALSLVMPQMFAVAVAVTLCVGESARILSASRARTQRAAIAASASASASA